MLEITLYSGDGQEVGMAHEVKSLKNQPQFFQMMMGQLMKFSTH